MSITAVAASYQSTAPTVTGQVIAQTFPGNDSQFFRGTAIITGDGATQTAVVQLIDGTKTIAFTPAWATACVIAGGTDTSAQVVGVTALSTSNISVKFNPAIGNAATCKIAFEIAK